MRQLRTYLTFAFLLALILSMGGALRYRMGPLSHRWFAYDSDTSKIGKDRALLDELAVENQLLKEMVNQLKEEWAADQLLSHQMERFFALNKGIKGVKDRKKLEYLQERIDNQMRFIRARVVFREPGTWGSYCWIDRGSLSSEGVLALNSPVVVGESVIGVIDFVGERKSRLQLITDAKLPISVEVSRGMEQNIDLIRSCKRVIQSIEEDQSNESSPMAHGLKELIRRAKGDGVDQYYATGEVFGSSHTLFRRKRPLLDGVGFNSEFGSSPNERGASSSIKVGDLLVTTGMDGVFPKGFHVAKVTYVEPMSEGSITTRIQALATFQDLDRLSYVEILPPIKEGTDFQTDYLF